VILGRATALWAGLVGAVINVVGLVLVIVTNQPLTPEIVALFAGINGLALALIGVLANVAVTGTYFGRGK
jgi:hypothetical protein